MTDLCRIHTPQDHVSIMVKAATGGENSSEPLPIVFTVPKFLPYKLQSVCADNLLFSNFTLLGYGDVGVPALLVMLALKFDLHLWPGRWTKAFAHSTQTAWSSHVLCIN